MSERRKESEEQLSQWQRWALIAVAAGVLLSLLGLFLDRDTFFRSYLLGVVMWTGIATACMALLMMHHLTGGPWGFALRRFVEAGMWSLPLLALLFIPLLFALPQLYEWARFAAVAADPLLQHKQPFLNVPFFMGRTAVYFLIWIGMAWVFLRWSHQQDENDDPALVEKEKKLSSIGLAIYLFTGSLAAIDWIMSLEPRWYSTVFGLLVVAGNMLAALALALIGMMWLRNKEPLSELVQADMVYDMGNLLLGFLLFWVYILFVQYLVIWSGNLPEETPWVVHRLTGSWHWVLLAVVLLGFLLPFGMLLSTGFEPRPRLITAVTTIIVAIQLLTTYWLVLPTFYPEGWQLHWLHFVLPLTFGGIWLTAVLTYLRRTPLLPQQDPRLKEIFEEREHIQTSQSA